MTWWAVFDAAGAAIATNVAGDTRAAIAAQYPPGTKIVRQEERVADAAFKKVDVTGALVDDLPAARAWALARIDHARAAAGDAMLTQGQSVTLAYKRKGDEAVDYASLSAAVLATLDLTKLRARFPFLMASADRRGVTIATVAAEVRTGKAASEAGIARVEATADAAKHAVRAATTSAAIIAAANPDWSK